jgi:hypothetical protein
MNKFFVAFFLSVTTMMVIGQGRKCGTEDLIREYRKNHPISTLESIHGTLGTLYDSVVIIPTVVHIMHGVNDSIIGTKSNLSKAQIESQIAALNRDFNRENWDSVATDPMFKQLRGNARILFQLAEKDPQGNATSGIVRVPYANSYAHGMGSDDVRMKNMSRWNPEKYFNLWVVGEILNGTLGYSYLPYMLATDSTQRRKLDGVVIGSYYFGSAKEKAPSDTFYLDAIFNLGRTTVHEVGHYFNLDHTWGNGGGCSSTDSVNDTPISLAPIFGCQNGPFECGNYRMTENYMEYSDDRCMNIFTKGQVERMRYTLRSYPFRFSLVDTSNLRATGLFPYEPKKLVLDSFIGNFYVGKTVSRKLSGTVFNRLNQPWGGSTVYLELKTNPSGNSFLDSVQVSANGRFEFQLPTPTAEGVYSFHAYLTNPNFLVDSVQISTKKSAPKNQFWVGMVEENGFSLQTKMAYPMDVTATLGDAMGRVLQHKKFDRVVDGTLELDFPFPTGVYWIRLETEIGVETVKWIQR